MTGREKDMKNKDIQRLKLKICGMKYPENIVKVAALNPDYLGFIFYKASQRNFEGEIPEISEKIKKTGVFVNSREDFILQKIKKYNLKAVQLHGNEGVEFCRNLSDKLNSSVEIIKVFQVDDSFDFDEVLPYENVCNYFLFDTRGKEKGGNGVVFNWELLKNYKSSKPYFLSGGIGLIELERLNYFFNSGLSKNCIAIDVNSRFEDQPGLKNIKKLELFIKDLNQK